MERLTAEDLQKIATLIDIKAGIKMMIIPCEFIKEGSAFLQMNPKDIESMKEIFELIPKAGPNL